MAGARTRAKAARGQAGLWAQPPRSGRTCASAGKKAGGCRGSVHKEGAAQSRGLGAKRPRGPASEGSPEMAGPRGARAREEDPKLLPRMVQPALPAGSSWMVSPSRAPPHTSPGR